ncbi:MAG: RNA polymerase sigma factor [Alphaproteobacteria bacterium]|nr:RNA polymerase sigma factor [Alphaproteobacteria bacterium]
MDSQSDEALMAAIGQGDQRAFARLVERHSRRAAALAARITLNRSDAEEVVQEAFLRVWTKAPAWRPQAGAADATFATWFRRVLVNLCIDRRRRPVNEDIDKVPEMADDAPSAPEQIDRLRTARRVNAAVAELPERQRAALALCHFEGVSNIEAADVLGISVGAVESLLVRARRALKTSLADLAGDGSAAPAPGSIPGAAASTTGGTR